MHNLDAAALVFGLTFTRLLANKADNKLMIFFFLFSQENRLSAAEIFTQHDKC